MTVHVSVTSEDIQRGTPGQPCRCPVAIATGRALGSPASVGVFTVYYELDENGVGERSIDLPYRIVEWVRDFDARLPVSPIEFDLDLA
jgi:hypothetical protein